MKKKPIPKDLDHPIKASAKILHSAMQEFKKTVIPNLTELFEKVGYATPEDAVETMLDEIFGDGVFDWDAERLEIELTSEIKERLDTWEMEELERQIKELRSKRSELDWKQFEERQQYG